jgi:hypothetical protein
MARGDGFEELFARAGEIEQSFAFGAVRGLLQARIANMADEERERVLSGQALLALRALGLTQETFRSDGDAQAVLGGLYWLCVGLAQERPLLLALDDVHWCDETSPAWLAYALPRFEGLPVIVALSYRPAEPGTQTPALIAELARAESTELLIPGPLSRRAIKSLIAQALATEPGWSFVDSCCEATRGSPFLPHELLLEIEAAHIPPDNANAAQVATLGSRRVSETVLARVRRLGSDAQTLTRSLAVLGERVTPAVVAALSGLDEQRTVMSAAALVDAGVLAEGFPLEWAHPLVRSAIYEHLPYAERLAAHAQAARILAEAGARADAIAAHLLITPPNGDAWSVGVLRRAGGDAMAQGSPQDAVRFLRRALQEPQPGQRRHRRGPGRLRQPQPLGARPRLAHAAPGARLAAVVGRADRGVRAAGQPPVRRRTTD